MEATSKLTSRSTNFYAASANAVVLACASLVKLDGARLASRAGWRCMRIRVFVLMSFVTLG